ncbi:aldo/keto reductase family protein [Ceratobasidium sp. AG-Ba]|nr:aldo/keto reductase family protein [Ceratobasidium sp. AG-Ba]QRV99541.1 aldo/keto reductase family protein [Ceratobasidium sp. AG-Ba]
MSARATRHSPRVSSIGDSAPIIILIPPAAPSSRPLWQRRDPLRPVPPDARKPRRGRRRDQMDGVRERMERMRTQRVDLLQFHWQHYEDKAYLQALNHLRDLQSEGIITAIGLCNFDTIRTDEICTSLGPGAIVSNQVQFSLIDTRPLDGMADVCEKHGIKLLTYGSLCGGFLADKWLGAPEPDAYRETMTPSQRKYLDVITSAWGTWTLFQTLLRVLRQIGDRHGGVSIANVATRWVLGHSFVGAVIIGARLGVSEHTSDNMQAFTFRLTPEDLTAIENVLDQSNGRLLVRTIGDCGSEYR